MRTLVLLVMALVVVAAVVPAQAADVTEHGFSFGFAVRQGKVDVVYGVKFLGEGPRELSHVDYNVYPLPGERVVCQISCANGRMDGKDVQFSYAFGSKPEECEWKPFDFDSFGWSKDLGCYEVDKLGRGYQFQIRAFVKNGIRKDIRLFGIKDPITNGLLKLASADRKDVNEYEVILINPTPQQTAGCASSAATCLKYADAEKTNQNLAVVRDGVVVVDGKVNAVSGRVDGVDARVGTLEDKMETVINYLSNMPSAPARPAVVAPVAQPVVVAAVTAQPEVARGITLRNPYAVKIERQLWVKTSNAGWCRGQVPLALNPHQWLIWVEATEAKTRAAKWVGFKFLPVGSPCPKPSEKVYNLFVDNSEVEVQ